MDESEAMATVEACWEDNSCAIVVEMEGDVWRADLVVFHGFIPSYLVLVERAATPARAVQDVMASLLRSDDLLRRLALGDWAGYPEMPLDD